MSTDVDDIVTALTDEISTLEPGSKISSEHALMRRFGVSRAMVRGAIGKLEGMHLVRRRQGAGTFVNRRIDYVISPTQAPSLHKTVRDGGGHCQTVLIGHDRQPLPETAQLRLGTGAVTTQHLTRLSHINDLPAVYLEEWIPDDVCAHAEVAVNVVRSVDETLRGVGHDPVRAWCQASLEIPPAYARERLELDDHQQTWVVESAIRDRATGTPLFFSRGWTRTLGWHDLVDLTLVPSEAGRGRPHPDLPLVALLRTGTSRVSALAVAGDTTSDVKCGLRAGASIAAGVLTGAHDRDQLAAAGATHVFADVTGFADEVLARRK